MEKIGIAVVSPSSGLSAKFPNRVRRGIKVLSEMGFEVYLGEHAMGQGEISSASVSDRVQDIHAFLADERVGVIMTSIGGFSCNRLLPFIDYKKIAASDKLFCGYSDTTALLLAIYAKCGKITLYGPSFLTDMCEFSQPYDYTVQAFENALRGGRMRMLPSDYFIEEYIDWAVEESGGLSAKHKTENYPWKIIRNGRAKGKLIGGNLQVLVNMIGTEYCPEKLFDGNVLFLEDISDNYAFIESLLVGLSIRKIYDRVSGIIIGKFVKREMGEAIDKLLDSLVGAQIPIICDVDFGHIYPKLTIPIGAETELFADEEIDWTVDF